MTNDTGRMLDGVPPLKAVEAFVAVSETGSFTDAAFRLGVSTSGLSRRIKTLEDYLGEKLFVRGKTRATLTPAGQAYLDAARKALMVLVSGRTDALHAERTGVAITGPQFFINLFIAPNLAEFEDQHSDIALTIDTNPRLYDLREEDFDLAIRYGVGDWAGFEIEPIFIAAGGPVCGPVLANGLALPKRIEAFSQHTLLHFRQEPRGWARFFEAAGFKGVKGAADRYFDDADLLYAAACQGLGLALADTHLAAPLLESGDLVQPIPMEIATGDGFHFVFAPGARQRPAVRRFCDWILDIDGIQTLRTRQEQFGY